MTNNTLDEIFENFNDIKVCIIGDVMIDAYVWGKVERISPEAPVPVVQVSKQELRLGGAANVALNIQALGAIPVLCGVIGKDSSGQDFLKLLTEKNMSVDGMIESTKRPTTVKHRIIAGSQHLLRIDAETDKVISASERKKLIELVKQQAGDCKVIIFEDYDKGVLDKESIAEIIAFANEKNIPTIVDPKKRNFLHYEHATLFKPNLKELREGLKIDFDVAKPDELQLAVTKLKERLKVKGVLATLSERGVYIDFDTEKYHLPAHIRTIADVSGAGDTVVSIAALGLALGLSPDLLASLANLGGGIVCEYTGVVPIPKERLLEEAKLAMDEKYEL
jgi:rfaE bifunctional protein kinase chain/domain